MPNRQRMEMEGHVVFDPELATTKHGTHFFKFRLACNDNYKANKRDQSDGKESTIFCSVVLWKDRALAADKLNLRKGSAIKFVGKISRLRAWNDNAGNPRPDLEFTAFELSRLDYVDNEWRETPMPYGEDEKPQRKERKQYREPENDDDIPF